MAYKATDTCLAKVGDDEPIFVLRAQDAFAATLIRLWADLAELHSADQEKVDEARDCADKMDQWPTKKWPD